jgi:hypothetical protein
MTDEQRYNAAGYDRAGYDRAGVLAPWRQGPFNVREDGTIDPEVTS